MRVNFHKHPIEASVYKEALSFDNAKFLVALSGGADSVTAAYILKNIGFEIISLHCNFHLRGEESNRDMNFVVRFCKENGIPLEIEEFDVTHYIKKNRGSSLEMACRELRHKWFQDKLKEYNYTRIVTGHNADDNIETFFLNMLRGSGTKGLRGMIKDNGIIWRPLLNFHRTDILNYIKDKKINYVVDSTNLENDYRRNYLRNTVIPLLKKEWKGFDMAMDKTIRNISTENKIVEKMIGSFLPYKIEPLFCETILQFPAPLLLIQRYISPVGPFVATSQEIYNAIIANKPHIRKWKLKKGYVYLNNKKLSIEMSHSE